MLGTYIKTQPRKAERRGEEGAAGRRQPARAGEEDVTELGLGWETREKKLVELRADRESRATTAYEICSCPSYPFSPPIRCPVAP